MKKKLLAGLLLATLAIGTLSPTSSEAAAKKATTVTKAKTQTKKTKTPTKIDGVAIKDLIAGKYNDIATVKSKIEEERIHYREDKKKKKKHFCTDYIVREWEHDYKIDKYIKDFKNPISKRTYGKDYKDKTIDYGDGYIVTYTDEDINMYIYQSLPYYLYNHENVLKAEDSRLYFDTVTVLGSREEEVAKWKLDPSCFKTTKAKLTDDEIIIEGTYTFSVKKIRGKVNLYSAKEYIEGYNFDRDFFDYTKEDHLKRHKSVKCNATAIFHRDTKQLKSLELKAKLPKKGYYVDQWEDEAVALHNAYYTFEHRLTEAQQAKRVSKITEEEMIEGKVNKFKEIKCVFYGTTSEDIDLRWVSRDAGYGVIIDNQIHESYVWTKYMEDHDRHSAEFDLSRFNITSSKTEKDVITITGVYKIDKDSDIMYDSHASVWLYDWYHSDVLFDYDDDVTADVTIEFNSKTKAMEKVTLQYNFDNTILTKTSGEVIKPGSVGFYSTYTFNNN